MQKISTTSGPWISLSHIFSNLLYYITQTSRLENSPPSHTKLERKKTLLAWMKYESVAVPLFLAALVAVASSERALVDEIRTSCNDWCRKEHKLPADSKQCEDFCVFSSKYLIEAYDLEKVTSKRLDKFRVLCNEGCPKEFKDPNIIKKCVDYCNVEAKEMTETFAKDKIE